ncbi:MAG: helix-turn-helix domain-containing protein [Oscillospiraceae bacterium]|jgi:transcriptional regulator with XRE-family HTH domain|nr:helix-turn-helix domain-containing protein [Oscillospiraceae bacterium]
MCFHENLMRLRKTNGFSQEELGAKLNVTRQTVSKWELGQTTPEMDKLIEMAKLFGISVDELVGVESAPDDAAPPLPYYPRGFHYEYKSQRTLYGLPLVHINLGAGLRKAEGIIAVGTIAKGVVSLGAISMGVLSFGAISLGVFALGAVGVGLLAIAAFAIGCLAIGAIAAGLFAVGGVALGVFYAVGGFASAGHIAMGAYAQGHIAIGDVANGDYFWENINDLTKADFDDIRATILREYPRIWKWILNIFTHGFNVTK